MLKGHTYKSQVFENPIFRTFVNTFMNNQNGIFSNYKNAMNMIYTTNTISVNSGLICIQGGLIEEDSTTTITGLDSDYVYCKLVLEVDLDKENTDNIFNQVQYKVIKSPSTYPNLTQTDIMKNNTGIYQYELARFRTTDSGIANFQDMRTFIDDEQLFLRISNIVDNLADTSTNKALSANQGKTLNEKLETTKKQLEVDINNINNKFVKTSVVKFSEVNRNYIEAIINYPSGFNKDNTSVIEIEVNDDYNNVFANGYSYYMNNRWTSSHPVYVQKTNANLVCRMDMEADTGININVRLTLMKV